ncbi:MAG: hypothetical protein IKX84_03200 [Clostridia bacterium]|nr:hypothetical protein [Clostridia bacterium]
MKRFICLVIAVLITLASVAVMYPSLLEDILPREKVLSLIPDGQLQWDEQKLGLSSFPFYGTEDESFYGVFNLIKDLAPFLYEDYTGTPDMKGMLGQITANEGVLQALYSFLILCVVSIPIYMILRLIPFNTLQRMAAEWAWPFSWLGQGVFAVMCGVSCVCITWLGCNTLIFQGLLQKFITWIGGQKMPDLAMNVGNILLIAVALLIVIGLLKTTLFRGSLAVSLLTAVFRVIVFLVFFAFISVFIGHFTWRVILYGAGFVLVCGVFESITERNRR